MGMLSIFVEEIITIPVLEKKLFKFKGPETDANDLQQRVTAFRKQYLTKSEGRLNINNVILLIALDYFSELNDVPLAFTAGLERSMQQQRARVNPKNPATVEEAHVLIFQTD